MSPAPFRLLLAWPEPSATRLRRELRPHRPSVEVFPIPVLAVDKYLHEAGYYHVLVITLEDWRALASNLRYKFSARVSLVALGPGHTTPSDFTDVPAGLGWSVPSAEVDDLTSLTKLFLRLAQGWSVAQCLEHNPGEFMFAGTEPQWPKPASPAPLAEAIRIPLASAPTASSADRPVIRNEQDIAINHSSGVEIGKIENVVNTVSAREINVAGDVVHGNKEVHQAEGDQVIQSNSTAVKLVQHAGGDQVNLNRFPAGSMPAMTQTSDSDQVNVNSALASGGTRICPQCAIENEAANSFCGQCGTKLG